MWLNKERNDLNCSLKQDKSQKNSFSYNSKVKMNEGWSSCSNTLTYLFQTPFKQQLFQYSIQKWNVNIDSAWPEIKTSKKSHCQFSQQFILSNVFICSLIHRHYNQILVIVIFVFITSASAFFPESTTLLSIECDAITNNSDSTCDHKLNSRFNWVM